MCYLTSIISFNSLMWYIFFTISILWMKKLKQRGSNLSKIAQLKWGRAGNHRLTIQTQENGLNYILNRRRGE